MRMLVFGEYLFAGLWRPEAWVRRVCVALSARGHDITLACDGARDLGSFAPWRVIARRPLRTWRATSPISFARWARRVAREEPHDASLSFTPLVDADANLPIGGPLTTLRLMGAVLNPLALGLELLHQPTLPAAVLLESAVRRSGRGVRLRFGLPRDGDTAAAVGYASRLPWAGEDRPAQQRTRARVRELLGIGLRRPVVLISCVHPKRPGLEPMLLALAEARAEAREALAPIALAVGRNAYSAHAAAMRTGCPEAVRPIGGTDRFAEVLDACDLVLAQGSAGGEGSGRLVADALRRGRPALADREAPGADLLVPGAHNRYSAPGTIVERRTASAWREALTMGLDGDRREAAAEAALEAGRGLSMDRFAARLEDVLASEHARRRARTALSRP